MEIEPTNETLQTGGGEGTKTIFLHKYGGLDAAKSKYYTRYF
jgi:hypothetical protein